MKLLLILALLAPTALQAEKNWTFEGGANLNFSWTANENFIGMNNSPFINPAGSINFAANYKDMPHEWRNRISWSLGYNYSPPPKIFVKNVDVLKFQSEYFYHIKPNTGFFGSLKLRTSALPSKNFEKGTTYIINDVRTGKQIDKVGPTNQFYLSDAFAPLFLEQWAGFFTRPVDEKHWFLEFKVAAVGRENFADNQRVITCYSCTNPQVEQLINVYELGPGASLLFKAFFFEKKLSYLLEADFTWIGLQEPVIRPINSFSRVSYDINNILAFHALSWLSLNWNLRLIGNPAVLDKPQFLSTVSLAAHHIF
ncbi:MAG: DUF3078 domain-containing protein [Deltaproteobacteria bacterium]|nr:DUF3078 domain-containing protein [Deltaproteobacteria bacterium]